MWTDARTSQYSIYEKQTTPTELYKCIDFNVQRFCEFQKKMALLPCGRAHVRIRVTFVKMRLIRIIRTLLKNLISLDYRNIWCLYSPSRAEKNELHARNIASVGFHR